MNQVYLALDTSGIRTALALVKDDKPLYETTTTAPDGHNEKLLDLIKDALDQTGLTLNHITAIGLTIGPGMFTSLRVGLSVAKGLALTRKLPVKGVNTLYALAATAGENPRPVLALIDARRAQLYAGLYLEGNALLRPTVLSPEQLPAIISQLQLTTAPLSIAGDGAPIAIPFLNQLGIAFEHTGVLYPSPFTVAQIARKLLDREGPDDINELEPLYLRRTDAELKRAGNG